MTIDLSARAEPGFQRRSVALSDYEFRDDGPNGWWTFEGVACTVDHPYSVRDWLGEYTETIATGAFNRSINDPNARISLHVNHQHGKAVPLATRSSGTLEVVADPNLVFRASLNPKRPDIQIVREAVKDGLMSEMSIGFSDVKGGVTWNDEYTERTVTDLRLREASIVEDGCNDLTTASVRSLAQELARYNTTEIDEAEIRRAIAWLSGLLSQTDDANEVVEAVEERVEGSGLIVTDDFIEMVKRRHWLPAA